MNPSVSKLPRKELFEDPNWDVFVAYSSPDRAIACEVAGSLRAYLRVFIDVDGIEIGDQWDHVLRDALETSSVVLVVVSPTSDSAFYEREELLRAIERMRRNPDDCAVVPLYVGNISPSDPRVPYGLKPLQGVSLSNTTHEELGRKLVQRIAQISPARIETPYLSLRISKYFEKINQEVFSLTAEQYRVIQQLRHLRRVRISGCAGSGKTLVAAEKCARLAASGQRTLFLCHNPLLAELVTTMLMGSSTVIRDFCAWVDSENESHLRSDSGQWTHFEEPTGVQLVEFKARISEAGFLFDAIVVDESQDFRDEWWGVVEAALSTHPHATLYIFHDNNQSLLPRRGKYPIDEPQIDLSRNCRNAGKIYELMRFFDSGSPEPELRLQGLGEVTLMTFDSGKEAAALESLIRQHAPYRSPRELTVLWAGQESTAEAPIANLEIAIPVCSPWQDEVRWQFKSAARFLSQNGLSIPTHGYDWVHQKLSGLSEELYPTNEDILLVQETAGAFNITADVRSRITKTRPFKFGFHWVVVDNRVTLRRRGHGRWWGSEVIIHFENPDWHEGLPKPSSVRVVPYTQPQSSNCIPLYSISEYKGLESDTIILIMRGRIPSHRNAVYVGISRARGILAIAADNVAIADFPRSFLWDHVDSVT
jgi:hypothetical protein